MAKTECALCGLSVSVRHVLWECPAYKDSWDVFMAKVRDLLGESFKDLNHYMGNVERSSYELGCELWDKL